ncbi:hypothetical protein DVH24_021736 [Malus domestica]|uniref:Uncharacterized protein n=1 Tax=Malus domestica TaxID=3750 RepID=A0A498KQR9_MALDO|nr:hypothetical protein DVH24_021736 [Malus domestica]
MFTWKDYVRHILGKSSIEWGRLTRIFLHYMGVIHWKFCPSLHYMGVIHWGLLKLPTYAALVEDPEFCKYIDLYAKLIKHLRHRFIATRPLLS